MNEKFKKGDHVFYDQTECTVLRYDEENDSYDLLSKNEHQLFIDVDEDFIIKIGD